MPSTAAASVTSSRTTKNSSPPSRATRSVARGLAVRVVDLLEAVQIDERAGEPRAVAPRPLDGLLQRRGQAGAVGKPGERIAVGERLDPLAHERGLGDVAAHAAIP